VPLVVAERGLVRVVHVLVFGLVAPSAHVSMSGRGRDGAKMRAAQSQYRHNGMENRTAMW
jgi:hypothetical protein